MTKNNNTFNGRTVTIKEHENINQALRRFKRKVDESSVLEVAKEKESYIKPTTQRKTAKAAAKARWRKKLRNEQLPKKLF
jgi:small subunit ribosomal protein S21